MAAGPMFTPAGGGSAVSVNALMTAGNSSDSDCLQAANVTSTSGTGITIAAGSNRLLVAVVSWCKRNGEFPVGRSVTWNSVSMTEVAYNENASTMSCGIYTLIAPDTGSQTLAVSWTNTGNSNQDVYMGAVCFDNVQQSSNGINAAHTVQNEDDDSVTITSDTNGATVAICSTDSGNPTMNQTKIFDNIPFSQNAGASYALGGTSNTHSFTGGTPSQWANAGIHIVSA
jgi:hypothetical protein